MVTISLQVLVFFFIIQTPQADVHVVFHFSQNYYFNDVNNSRITIPLFLLAHTH